MSSCSKRNEFFDSSLSTRSDSLTALSPLNKKIFFDEYGNILINQGSDQAEILHATYLFQKEVSDYIFENLSFKKIDSIRLEYGLPVWKLATLKYITPQNNPNDLNNYRIIIPTVKDNHLTGIIIYKKVENVKSAVFYSKDDINSIINMMNENDQFYQMYFSGVISYQFFNYVIERKNIDGFTTWLPKALKAVRNEKIHYRMVLYLDCYTILTSYYDPATYTETVVESEECVLTYSSGGGYYYGTFGDDFGQNTSSSSDGGNTNGENNNNKPKEDKDKKLKCAAQVADFMAQAEILNLIENNEIIDPCDPTKNSADLLSKALEGYCYAKNGDEPLNLMDAEHFMDAILEGQINQSIECMDENGGFDIDDDKDYNINECEKILIKQYPIDALKIFANKQIAENMTKNKFGFNGRNDCSDAFRHAFFNAINTKSVGAIVAQLFAVAHECGNSGNDLKMDMSNNYYGIDIVNNNYNNYISNDLIANEICSDLEAGKLLTLSDPLNNDSQLTNSYGCKCN